MLVFVAGMQRSGSTFSFNVVRELLAKRGVLYQEPHSSIHAVIPRSGEADHIIIKAHVTDEHTLRLIKLGAVKAICTVRKPEDAIASWMETFDAPLSDAIDRLEKWFGFFEQIRKHALIVRYEDIDKRPFRAAWKISRALSVDATPLEIYRIAKTHDKRAVKEMADSLSVSGEKVKDVGFSYYDERTYYHRRHVSHLTSLSAEERIGHEAVKVIRHYFTGKIDAWGEII